MQISDIKLKTNKPILIDFLLIEDQDIENVSVGRIFEKNICDSNVQPFLLKNKQVIIKNIWLTPDIGLYVSFGNPLEAYYSTKTEDVIMTSNDAGGNISCDKISLRAV